VTFKATKSSPQIFASANIPLEADTVGNTPSHVNLDRGLTSAFATGDVELTVWGTNGSVAVLASCITPYTLQEETKRGVRVDRAGFKWDDGQLTGPIHPHKVPRAADQVNYVDQPYYPAADARAATTKSVDVASPLFKTYTSTQQQLGQAVQEKAFLLGCTTGDMPNGHYIVQLASIRGAAEDSVLVLTALDSGISHEYRGANVAQTFTRSDDITTFSASSQYYVTWSSNTTTANTSGLTLSYHCGTSDWFLSGIGLPRSGAASATLSFGTVAVLVVTFLAW